MYTRSHHQDDHILAVTLMQSEYLQLISTSQHPSFLISFPRSTRSRGGCRSAARDWTRERPGGDPTQIVGTRGKDVNV